MSLNATWPSTLAKCTMLSGGAHRDASLLNSTFYWLKYAKVELPGAQGKWIANPYEWWMREVQLSKDQLGRSLQRLEGRGLIERRQWWFGKKNILHVRPSEISLSVLRAVKSWHAATLLLLPRETGLLTQYGESAEPGSAFLHLSNEFSDFAHPSLADVPISNAMSNDNTYVVGVSNKQKGAGSAGPHSANLGEGCYPEKTCTNKESVEVAAVWRLLSNAEKSASFIQALICWQEYASCLSSLSTSPTDPVPHLSVISIAAIAEIHANLSWLSVQHEGEWKEADFTPVIGEFIKLTFDCWPKITARAKEAAGLTEVPSYPDAVFLSQNMNTAVPQWLSASLSK